MKKKRPTLLLHWSSVVLCYAFLLLAGCRESAQTAVPKLIAQLKSKDAHQRNLAALDLANYGPQAKDAVRPLIDTLWDKNMGVRTSAAVALTAIDTPEAKKAIAHYKKEKEKLKAAGPPQSAN